MMKERKLRNEVIKNEKRKKRKTKKIIIEKQKGEHGIIEM